MIDEIPAAEFGLVPVADVAAERGVSVRTVQRWIEDGLIPVLAAGPPGRRVYLLRKTDLDEFTPPVMGRPKTGEPAAKPNKKSKRGTK